MRITTLIIGILSAVSVMAQTTLVTTTNENENAQSNSERVKQPLYKGSFLQMSVGAGHSELWYPLSAGTVTPTMPSFTAHLGYAYYFLPWMGVGTGLGFNSFCSEATLTNSSLTWGEAIDSEGTPYEHHIKVNNWKETQLSYMAEIPIALHFKHNFGCRVGFFGMLGAKIAVPVYSKYTVETGALQHTGYYPQWDLTLRNLPGRFESESYIGQTERLYSGIDNKEFSHFATVNFFATAELGLLFQLGKRTDLLLGFYSNYGINNMHQVSEVDKHELGFDTPADKYDFMEQYNGLIGTKAVGDIHPWSGGVKIGLNIYLGKIAEKKKEQPQPQIKYVRDTIYLRDTITLPGDTIIRVKEVKAEKQLDDMLNRAVIWFNLNSYTPILEPHYILDSVAAVLSRHPETLIAVNGYACKMGKDEYNQRLALKRAHTVADLLQKKGVPERQIIVSSYGSHQPFHYDGEHQLARDRRVEIIPLNFASKASENEYLNQRINEKNNAAIKPIVDEKGEPVYQKYDSFQGEEILKHGSRLAQIARRWYQIPEFWVYIYEANADRIADPNNVVPGITIMIPRLESIVAGRDMKTVMEEVEELKKKYIRK